MTKSERIRKHYEDGFLSVKEIAELVGCDPAYVRVVARQRAGGQSVHDKRYREANIVEIREMTRKRNYERYHGDPEYRAKCISAVSRRRKERYRSDPDFRARIIAQVKRWRQQKKAAPLEAAE